MHDLLVASTFLLMLLAPCLIATRSVASADAA